MFGGPLSLKTYASFVRRYGSNRPAQHPKQKVSAIKLSVTASHHHLTLSCSPTATL
jgi:hypothetical protein